MTVTRLRVSITDADGRRISRGPAAGLAAWLARHGPARARGDVAIAILSDAAMRRLNRTHRGQDKVTDVLSFENGAGPAFPGKVGPALFLGDIAIAAGRAGSQARAAGHATRTELQILALHGLLHLMGYDHDRDRGEMARAEERLRRRAGLPAGLIGRTAGRPRSRHT